MILLLDSVDNSPDGSRTPAVTTLKFAVGSAAEFLCALHSFKKTKDNGMLIRSEYRACVKMGV